MSKLGAVGDLVNKFRINRALAKTNFGYVEGYLYVSQDDERQFIQNVVDSIGYLPDSLIDEMSPRLIQQSVGYMSDEQVQKILDKDLYSETTLVALDNSVLNNRDVTYDHLVYSDHTDVQTYLAELGDEEHLVYLIRHGQPETQARAVPKVPDNELDALMELGTTDVVYKAIARRGRPQDLDVLVRHDNEDIRAEVAAHKRDTDLDLLVHDKSNVVLLEVAIAGRPQDLDVLMSRHVTDGLSSTVVDAVLQHKRPQDLAIACHDTNPKTKFLAKHYTESLSSEDQEKVAQLSQTYKEQLEAASKAVQGSVSLSNDDLRDLSDNTLEV